MFTGLVEDVGVIERIERTEAGRELRIRSSYDLLTPGESVAVNGACLTVRTSGPGWFDVAAVETTLGRTTIGSWTTGRRVNLERALRLGDRLGGHIVQGHVDDVCTVSAVDRAGDSALIELDLPDELFELMVPHGSVAVDGVSLTVNALSAPGVLQVSIIDFTWQNTTLADLAAGDQVHVEADILGKYVRQLVAPRLSRLPLSSRA